MSQICCTFKVETQEELLKNYFRKKNTKLKGFSSQRNVQTSMERVKKEIEEERESLTQMLLFKDTEKSEIIHLGG